MGVELNYRSDCAIVTLNNPKKLNSLNFNMIKTLSDVLDEISTKDIRGLIFTGAGKKAFCSGADVSELLDIPLNQLRKEMKNGQETFNRVSHFNVPTLAVINGVAFGGGLELAMACNLRIAVSTARMALPEIKLGAVPGYGGTQRLPRLIGEGRALDMLLTGRAIGSAEALKYGLINKIIDNNENPLSAGLMYLGEIGRYSLPSINFVRQAVQLGLAVPIIEGLKIEREMNALSFQTKDAAEGIRAFIEKRDPAFTDE